MWPWESHWLITRSEQAQLNNQAMCHAGLRPYNKKPATHLLIWNHAPKTISNSQIWFKSLNCKQFFANLNSLSIWKLPALCAMWSMTRAKQQKLHQQAQAARCLTQRNLMGAAPPKAAQQARTKTQATVPAKLPISPTWIQLLAVLNIWLWRHPMLVCPQVPRAKSFDERAECLKALDQTIEGELGWARKMQMSRE